MPEGQVSAIFRRARAGLARPSDKRNSVAALFSIPWSCIGHRQRKSNIENWLSGILKTDVAAYIVYCDETVNDANLLLRNGDTAHSFRVASAITNTSLIDCDVSTSCTPHVIADITSFRLTWRGFLTQNTCVHIAGSIIRLQQAKTRHSLDEPDIKVRCFIGVFQYLSNAASHFVSFLTSARLVAPSSGRE